MASSSSSDKTNVVRSNNLWSVPGLLQMIFDAEPRLELRLIMHSPQHLKNVKHKWSITFLGSTSHTLHGFPLFKTRNEVKLVFWPEHPSINLSETDIPSRCSRRPRSDRLVGVYKLILTPGSSPPDISIFVHFSSPREAERIFLKRVDVAYRSGIIILSTNQRGHYRHIVLRSSSEEDWKED